MDNCLIIDGRRLLAYDALKQLGEYAAREEAFIATLWEEFMTYPILLEEFMYYIDHHNFSDKKLCREYGMTDLFVFQMSRYNLIRDIGKNTESCNKEAMVLGAFHDMAGMLKEPEKYIRRLSAGPGMDRL